MSFAFYDTGHVVMSDAWWRGQPQKTYLRGRGIEGKPKWKKAGFAVLSRLKRFCGTKRLLGYILCGLKRLFGTKLCGQHQSGPENGVNNDVILHRFGRRDFTLPSTTT